jgi:hypothetical protein
MYKGTVNNLGYHIIKTMHHGKLIPLKVHRLVAHCFVANPDNRPFVDHKDCCKTNNHVSNLRYATASENQHNRPKTGRGSSKYKGVSFDKTCGKWRTQIGAKRHKHHIGIFADELDAAAAYNKAALRLHGEYAWLNKIPSTSSH